MSTATVNPKATLSPNQQAWLKEMGTALSVNLQGATPQSTVAAATPGSPEKSTPGQPSGANPSKPAASVKRSVTGGGGYVYEQHSDGKIFIVQSPRHGKSHFEVKDRKGYDAILAEIGPFPTSPRTPGQAPAPGATGAANQMTQGGSAPQATGADSYRSQTDNPELAGGTCNVTTLAMQLLSLANGDETKLREEAVQLLKNRKVNAKTETQLEELLRQLTIKVAGGKQIKLGKSDTLHNAWEVAWVLDKVSELFTGYVSKTETIYPGTNQEGFEDKIVPAVQQGAAVMLSNHLTSGGHIVKLNSVRSDGVVIDDPNGCVVESQGAYLRNGASVNAALVKRIQDNAKVLDERLKLNSSLRQELTELAKAGKGKIPANAGKLNFYSWAEVGKYSIGKWANITYKK